MYEEDLGSDSIHFASLTNTVTLELKTHDLLITSSLLPGLGDVD